MTLNENDFKIKIHFNGYISSKDEDGHYHIYVKRKTLGISRFSYLTYYSKLVKAKAKVKHLIELSAQGIEIE